MMEEWRNAITAVLQGQDLAPFMRAATDGPVLLSTAPTLSRRGLPKSGRLTEGQSARELFTGASSQRVVMPPFRASERASEGEQAASARAGDS